VPVPLESRYEYGYRWGVGTSIPYLGREYKVAGGAGEGALARPETVNIDVVVHHHVQQVLALLRLKESGYIFYKKFCISFVGSGIRNQGCEEIWDGNKSGSGIPVCIPNSQHCKARRTALDRQDTATCETRTP
jgi:hypothetical protein